jgi:quinol monooxygenase YgiN
MDENVYRLLELSINACQLDNFKGLMHAMVEATRADEPGTLNYEWTISQDGTICHICERYANSTATMTHLGSFGAKFAGRFMQLVKPTRFVVYGTPSQEVTTTVPRRWTR